MKNLRNVLLCLVSIMLLAACTKEDPIEHGQDQQKTDEVNPYDSPEEILLFVASCYTIDSVENRTADYRMVFCNPTPVSMKKEYPDGIKEVILEKKDVKSYSDDGKAISITFSDEKTVTLDYDSWLEIQFEKKSVYFDEKMTPDTLSFKIVASKPDTVRITITGGEAYATSEVAADMANMTGRIVFTPKGGAYFTSDVSVEVTNGKKTVSETVSLVRENFKFADGTVSKSYSFREYERYFEIDISMADRTIEAKVSEDSRDWLMTKVSNENVGGVDKTTICVLIADNNGNQARMGQITVGKAGTERVLSIEIKQIASEMEGSLRKGLVAFYNGLNGSSWSHNDNWCSDEPIFEWYGITASNIVNKESMGGTGFAYHGTDDVWSLNLSANNMRGYIPMEFWEVCPCFESIRISSEYIPGTAVPDCLWHDKLESLDLSLSFMSVPLTDAVGKAMNLRELNLRSCPVNGPIPDALTGLRKLESLDMRECGLTGELPAALGNMKDLRELRLDHNLSLGGTIPDSFYSLGNLTDFDISATCIGGTLSSDISRLENLEGFWATGCEFEGIIPEEFGTLYNLSGYDFSGNYFEKIPEFVRYCGYNSKGAKEWVGSAGFPVGIPYYQRRYGEGRPDNYIVAVPDCVVYSEILVDGQPLRRPGYYVDYGKCHQLPFPVWANIRYGIWCWTSGRMDEMKYPRYPYADDLQYPVDEYYYDGKAWRHPKLEYPANEYYHDGKNWVHDASCPWDFEYNEESGN